MASGTKGNNFWFEVKRFTLCKTLSSGNEYQHSAKNARPSTGSEPLSRTRIHHTESVTTIWQSPQQFPIGHSDGRIEGWQIVQYLLSEVILSE